VLRRCPADVLVTLMQAIPAKLFQPVHRLTGSRARPNYFPSLRPRTGPSTVASHAGEQAAICVAVATLLCGRAQESLEPSPQWTRTCGRFASPYFHSPSRLPQVWRRSADNGTPRANDRPKPLLHAWIVVSRGRCGYSSPFIALARPIISRRA